MELQSFGFNLFGSKTETLPKTVSHHSVFCLFFPVAVESRQTCCHNRTVLEKILTFGRELQNMSIQLRREHGKNETNKKALQASIYAGDVYLSRLRHSHVHVSRLLSSSVKTVKRTGAFNI